MSLTEHIERIAKLPRAKWLEEVEWLLHDYPGISFADTLNKVIAAYLDNKRLEEYRYAKPRSVATQVVWSQRRRAPLLSDEEPQ